MKKGDLSKNSNLSRTFLDGSKRTATILESVAIGKGTFLPGWRWSEHVGPLSGKKSEKHVGYIVSGQMVVKSQEGIEIVVSPGEAFEVEANHDAWVLGDNPCIAIDFNPLENN